MDLTDVTFVVVDTETTGTRPDHNRVIEFGAVKVRNGQIIDRYQQLVNPGIAIPYQISRLTGITNSMVYAEPPVEEVIDDFLTFLGDDVFVAHNARFDRRFVNAELRRLDRPPMKNKTLCSARLARRLLSGLKSKGLTSLADFYSIPIMNRHRAFDDAEATGKILIRLLDKIRIQMDSPTLGDVLALQMRPYKSARPQPAHIKNLKNGVLRDLPAASGVYFMHDAGGDVIYVGKAKELKSRVRSYFNAIEAHPPRTRDLIRQVRNVSWTETGNELSALLLESRLIKQIQPRFNRALKRYGRKPFIKLDTASHYPSIDFTFQLVDDGAEYFGPVQGTRYARFLVDLVNQVFMLRECDDATLSEGRPCMYHQMGRCLAPCVGSNEAAYQDEVEKVRTFLNGEDFSVVDRLRARMQSAADNLDYEDAKRYRDWIDRLRRMLTRHRAIAANVVDYNAVIILPDDRRRLAHAFFVRFGKLAKSIRVESASGQDFRSQLVEIVRDVYDMSRTPPARYQKRDVDEVRILANWMFNNRDAATSVHWSREMNMSVYVDSIIRQLHSAIPKEDSTQSVPLDSDQRQI